MEKLYRFRTCFLSKSQTFETLLQNQCHLVKSSFVQWNSKQPWPSKRYVLYGDSVAAHLYPGLLSVVGENAIIQLNGGACQAIRSGYGQRCNDFYDWFVNEYVPNNRVDGIIVSSNWLGEYKRLGEKEFRVKLKDLFEKLKGHRVAVYSQAASLSVTSVNAALREETSKFGFDFIDVSQLFCSGDKCVVAKNGVFYFWDKLHLTLPGSVFVADRTYGLSGGTPAEAPSVVPDRNTDDILSTSAMMARNLDGTIRYWSEEAKNLYGWEPQDALDRTSHQLLKTVFPIPLEVIEEVLRVKGHWEGPLIHVRRDGSRVTVASRWDLEQKPYSQDRTNKVIEINGPLPISSSGSFRKELLSLLKQSNCSNSPPLCRKVS